MRRKCLRCGRLFVPARENYRYCLACFAEVAPLGHTTGRSRAGAPARIHGGASRVTDGLRPVTLRGDVTSRQIVEGMRSFLTDLYQGPTRISTLLSGAGIGPAEIEYLREQSQQNDFVLRFCPKLWEWLGPAIGYEARKVVVDFYALYGGWRRYAISIARSLGMTVDQAEELRAAALNSKRDPVKQAQLEAMAVSTARSVLEARQQNGQVSSSAHEHRPPR